MFEILALIAVALLIQFLGDALYPDTMREAVARSTHKYVSAFDEPAYGYTILGVALFLVIAGLSGVALWFMGVFAFWLVVHVFKRRTPRGQLPRRSEHQESRNLPE